LHLAEIRVVVAGKLQNDVSERRRHVAGTLQRDCFRHLNSARILTTDGVVPQRRCRHERRNVGQTDDEIVRPMNCTTVKRPMNDYRTFRLSTHDTRSIQQPIP